MATQLIQHERIETTHPRAKEVSKMADKCITLAKRGDWHARVQAGSIVRTDECVHKLFTILARRYEDRPGGYTRVIRSRQRLGDGAQLSLVEFVDRPGELRIPRPPPLPHERSRSMLPLAAQAALGQL